MNFSGFSGNEALRERLSASAAAGNLSHAYIIFGASAETRLKLAEILSSAMVCSSDSAEKPCMVCRDCRKATRSIHPDIRLVTRDKDKRYYGIDIIRDMVKDASILPNEADRKVYIIPEGDLLTPPCQNAALKILEEPPSFTSFIILADNPGSFLETFRSRCIDLFLSADNTNIDENSLARDIINVFTKKDQLGMVSAALRLEKCERPDMIDTLTALRDGFVKEAKSAGVTRSLFIEAADLTSRLLLMADANVGAGLIAGMLASGCNTILK